MYRIIIEGKNHKKITRFDSVIRKRVIAAIDLLAQNPRPLGKKIKHFVGITNGYRLRVGPIRVVYVIQDEQKTIFIVDVGYRGDIY